MFIYITYQVNQNHTPDFKILILIQVFKCKMFKSEQFSEIISNSDI